MADKAIVMGWNSPKPGREARAIALFERSLAFYGKLQIDGRIESFEPVFLSPHGGDMNGFILLRGDADKLAALRGDDEFLQIVVEAGYCLEGFGVIDGFIGGGIQKFLVHWNKLIGK